MGSNDNVYTYDGDKPCKITKWKIRVGSQLLCNTVILNFKSDSDSNTDSKDSLLKYKSNVGGTVTEILASEGDVILPGSQLLKVEPCTHPVIMKDLCAECGADLRHLDRDNFEKLTAATTFSMVHVVPELKVCLEQAEKLGRDDETRLLKSRKLVLLVDLDQTLIHTTNDNVQKDLPDVHHFQLYGRNSPWYHTKLRPGTKTFLENVSKCYELHICTFGARLYAHKIAQIIDPGGKFFSHRILSRDECFDATSKTANLKALFPRGDDMVCIIDDREDVWNFAPNVVHVKPYNYFHNTGDINAPPLPNIKDGCSSTTNCTKNPEDTFNEEEVANEKATTEEETAKEMNCDEKEISNENTTNEKETAEEKISNEKEITNEKTSSEKETTSQIEETSKAGKSSTDLATVQNDCQDDKSPSLSSKPEIKSSAQSELAHADDYLLYLEDILLNIHKEYYKIYDKMQREGEKSIPDVKVVVPQVRRQVLKGCNLVFSSIIPTNLHPETSQFWMLGESLGAKVTLDLVVDDSEDRTTHVVASKLGTAKVNAAKRHQGIFIVSLDWLFCCAERWEHADEQLFPLTKDIVPPFLDASKLDNAEKPFFDSKSMKSWLRSKRPHGSSKERKKRSKSEEEMFSERIFVEAGLSLSQDDIEDMDKEIEDACSEESDQESLSNSSSNSSSGESLSSADYPKGWKRPRREFDDIAKNEIADESSDVETIGSVDEEMAEAVKQEFGS